VGNSSITLQKMMDSVSAIGDLNPIFNNAGGFAAEPALTIANDVMSELLSWRFPWKWNQIAAPPFPLTSYQQDYATAMTQIGWLQNGLRIDINNSMYPPPTWPIYVVRNLAMSNVMGGFPYQVCWFYNRDLQQGIWPGPGVIYIEPIGANTAPQNASTDINDVYGNILVLSAYGTTGPTPPVAVYPPTDPLDPNSPPDYDADIAGQVIQDGSCTWTVMDPDAQGFRFNPMPPASGQVWLVRLWAQRKAVPFLTMQQKLDPIPDDQAKWFRDGCVAYAHRYSTSPAVKARYTQMRMEWLGAIELETKQNDREDENKGFFPDRSAMAPSYTTDPGPWPYRYGWGG
jgi:hypothetical protein